MGRDELAAILRAIAAGEISPDDAVHRLDAAARQGLEFAELDHGREHRTGFIEVVYCEGKSPDQVAAILKEQGERHQVLLATRADTEHAEAARKSIADIEYFPTARILRRLDPAHPAPPKPTIVVTAGTSDIPVAEEAALTAETIGHNVERCFDVGVAGLHRVAAVRDQLAAAGAVIVVAGMEGALPSVVAGLIPSPVIAVPTSVGYGVAKGGYVALLAMLASCAPGVTVVNIDNGFGAAMAAARINRPLETQSD